MYTSLAINIIKKAVIDLKDEKVSERAKNSAKKFFKSDWFIFLCDCLGVEDKIILERLKDYL